MLVFLMFIVLILLIEPPNFNKEMTKSNKIEHDQVKSWIKNKNRSYLNYYKAVKDTDITKFKRCLLCVPKPSYLLDNKAFYPDS